jgi:hypothetical protein
MWMMVPTPDFVQRLLASLEDYRFRAGSSQSAGKIGYHTP